MPRQGWVAAATQDWRGRSEVLYLGPVLAAAALLVPGVGLQVKCMGGHKRG